jgi:hypothetical protein
MACGGFWRTLPRDSDLNVLGLRLHQSIFPKEDTILRLRVVPIIKGVKASEPQFQIRKVDAFETQE